MIKVVELKMGGSAWKWLLVMEQGFGADFYAFCVKKDSLFHMLKTPSVFSKL